MAETKLTYTFTTTPNPVLVSIGGDSPAQNFVDLLVMIDNSGLPVGNVNKITIEILTGGSEGSSGPSSSTSAPAPSTSGHAPPTGSPELSPSLTEEGLYRNPLEPYYEDSAANLLVTAGQVSSAPASTAPAPATDGNTLSDSGLEAATLIRYDTDSPWDIDPSGSTIVITPKPNQAPGTVKSTIMFKLEHILVNTAPGNVAINITEEIPIKPPRPVLYSSFAKVDSKYPVKKFYVEFNGNELDPPVLYDQDLEGVLIKWLCTTQGEGKTYNLTQGNGQPVLGLSADDGKTGVSVDLAETSVIQLDVINPDGSRFDYLLLTVFVEKPFIEQQLHQYSICNGRLVRLHWHAKNAARCSVEVSAPPESVGTVIDDKAPANTYHAGYWLFTGNDPVEYGFRLHAFAGIGTAEAGPVSIDSVNVHSTSTFSGGPQAFNPFDISAAITTDNQTLLSGGFQSPLQLLNIQNGSTADISFGIANQVSGITVTPDGKFALMFDGQNLQIVEIDDPLHPRISATVLVSNDSGADIDFPFLAGIYGNSPICVTQNLALALLRMRLIFIDDIAHGHVAKSIDICPDPGYGTGKGGRSIAVTPDGLWAFAAVNLDQGEIRLIDVANQLQTTKVVAHGKLFNDVAVTPDGSLLLAVDQSGQSVMVIGIDQQQTFPLIATIPVSLSPTSVAITPDSRLALVTTIDMNTFSGQGPYTGSIAAIDIPRGVVLTNIPVDGAMDVSLMGGDPITLLTPSGTDATGNATGGTPIRAVVGTYGGSVIII